MQNERNNFRNRCLLIGTIILSVIGYLALGSVFVLLFLKIKAWIYPLICSLISMLGSAACFLCRTPQNGRNYRNNLSINSTINSTINSRQESNDEQEELNNQHEELIIVESANNNKKLEIQNDTEIRNNNINNEANDNNIINIMTDENKSSEPEIKHSADQKLSSNEEQEKEERKIIEIKNEERNAETKKNPVQYKKNKKHNNYTNKRNINKKETKKTYRNIHNTTHYQGLSGDFARRHDYRSYHHQFRP